MTSESSRSASSFPHHLWAGPAPFNAWHIGDLGVHTVVPFSFVELPNQLFGHHFEFDAEHKLYTTIRTPKD